MEVIFYKFNKCRNDTAQPSGGTSIQVRLKENCSTQNPILILTTPSWDYNYFLIPSFGRYYFVDNFTFLGNNTYQVNGSVDVMGTFRGDILVSTQYILRAETGFDSDIPDAMYPAKGGKKCITRGQSVSDVLQDYTQGIFVIGAIGKTSGYAGIPVVYYALDFAQMKLLNGWLFNSGNYSTMISDDIVKAFFNPMDYIISCMYFPYPIDTSSWKDTDIYFGWFKTEGVFAKELPNYWYTDTGLNYNVEIPKPYNDFRLLNPWTQYKIWLIDQFLDIPPEKLYRYKSLGISIQLDLVGGTYMASVDANVEGETSIDIVRTVGQFGCPISMAQLRQDWQGVVSNIGSSIGSVFSLDFSKTVGGVADAVNSFLPDPQSKGSNGALGSAFWKKSIELFCFYCYTTELNTNRLGRPVCKADTIINYKGYCITRAAEIEATNAYAVENDEIANIMNGGFYVN